MRCFLGVLLVLSACATFRTYAISTLPADAAPRFHRVASLARSQQLEAREDERSVTVTLDGGTTLRWLAGGTKTSLQVHVPQATGDAEHDAAKRMADLLWRAAQQPSLDDTVLFTMPWQRTGCDGGCR